jgi:hypothetical protein
MHTVLVSRSRRKRPFWWLRHGRNDNSFECNLSSYSFLKNNFNVTLPYTPKSSTKCEVNLVATYCRTSYLLDCFAGLYRYSRGTHVSKDWCTNQIQSSSVDNHSKIES